MAYPATKTLFTDPAGTQTLSAANHNQLHIDYGDTIEAIEDTVGTTAGTNVLKAFAAGDIPVRSNTSNVLQTAVQGTLNNAVLGTPAITGGTLTSPVVNVTSDASGDMYHRNASGAFTRFAMGAAGAFLNTDGTTPSWVTSRFTTGTFERDLTAATGTVGYTGVGFTLGAIIFIGVKNTAVQSSIGFSNGTGNMSIQERTSNGYSFDPASSMYIDDGSGNLQKGSVLSVNSNGYVISWTKTGSPTGTASFMYLAIR